MMRVAPIFANGFAGKPGAGIRPFAIAAPGVRAKGAAIVFPPTIDHRS
jgi:hypothetical protein